jgi:hypothetical protein
LGNEVVMTTLDEKNILQRSIRRQQKGIPEAVSRPRPSNDSGGVALGINYNLQLLSGGGA